MNEAKLYIISTPIGNLQDISRRAVDTLQNVSVIACEDTRVTSKLLAHCDISGKKLLSYYDQVEAEKSQFIVSEYLLKGVSVALVSDAGTPCISDPGYRLVKLAVSEGVQVVPIPGASAALSALVASGLPCSSYYFHGFLSSKKSKREQELKRGLTLETTVITYVPARDLSDILEQVSWLFPEITICVAREITKVYEDIKTGPVSKILEYYKENDKEKGEAVLMLDFGSYKATSEQEVSQELQIQNRAKELFLEGFRIKEIVKKLDKGSFNRSELYNLVLEVKNKVNLAKRGDDESSETD